MSANLTDHCFAWLQYLLPKQLLSRAVYHLMRSRAPGLKNLLIRQFLKGYAVDMAEAEESDPFSYRSFNAFFTRALRTGVRPLPQTAAVVSPVDGTVSQAGKIHGQSLLQAKGRDYSVLELLGGDTARAARYAGGQFACIYLAPHNYHRIHMPLTGTVDKTLYVPGALFSVNAATARAVPRLFARNERVVCEFTTEAGHVALVMVGALFVGSIETVWAGEINPPPRRRNPQTVIQGVGQTLARGAEMGRFNMGSTVIVLFEPGRVVLHSSLQPGSTVRMGQVIGSLAG